MNKSWALSLAFGVPALVAACGDVSGAAGARGAADVESTLRLPAPSPPRRIAFVLVDIGGGVNATAAEAIVRLMGPPELSSVPPLRDYFVEASYGQQDISAEVFGPLSHPAPVDTAACSEYPLTLAATLRPMVPGTFDAYFWYLGSRISCGWNGLASLGSRAGPTLDTWYNARLTGCTTLIQEPSHSYGLDHSSSLRCGTSPLTDDLQGCTHSEYGDVYDPVGQGCRHINGYQKTYLGWLQGCNVIQVRRSGSFNLLPLELPCDGTQMLQIPMPRPRALAHPDRFGAPSSTDVTHYYLELRTSRGVDNGLAPSVQVRVSGGLRPATEPNHHSWLLDMDPATSELDGLAAGASFTDPAGGLSIRVDALSADGATVVVELAGDGGEPLCLGGMALAAPGPGIESCASSPAQPNRGAGGSVGAAGSGGAGGPAGATGSGGSSGDAGTSGGGGSSGDAAAVDDAGRPGSDAGAGGDSNGDGGCGCALASPASGAAGWLGVVIGLAVVGYRRRGRGITNHHRTR
jgi:hypothetical protein